LNEILFEMRAASLGEQVERVRLLFVWFGHGYRAHGLGCQRLNQSYA
jgi:hypothetical protein